jgi:hypothetical protein
MKQIRIKTRIKVVAGYSLNGSGGNSWIQTLSDVLLLTDPLLPGEAPLQNHNIPAHRKLFDPDPRSPQPLLGSVQ